MAVAIETHLGVVNSWELDHMGHMNVQYYVAKFDQGTWQFFATLGMTPGYFRENKRGMAAVQQNITYRREMMVGDLVAVRTELLELVGRKIRFVHRMYRGRGEEEAALAEMTGLHIDTDTRKSCPFPAEILAAGRRMLESAA